VDVNLTFKRCYDEKEFVGDDVPHVELHW